MPRALLEVDTTERLGADDMATRREAEHLAMALASQPRAAAGRPGVCTNCGAQCLPLAVYCDEDCRADHEARHRAQARAGRAA